MQVKTNKPCTVYIQFTGQIPNTFRLFSDEHGLYYFRELQGKVPRIKFNIPHPGIYNSPSDAKIIKVVPIEIPDNLPEIPSYDRDYIKDFKIVDNPELTGSPMVIYAKEGIIERGRDFYKYPKPIRLFFILHEIGHFFYGVNKADVEKANKMSEPEGKAFLRARRLEGEKKCDQFAFIKFMEMGHNRSTAYYALKNVLSRSQDNVKRIKSVANNIQLTQQKSIYE